MILPDKLYTIIKWILCTVVPASIALISGLGLAYGWDTKLLITTISLMATFAGALCGISNAAYKNNNAQ